MSTTERKPVDLPALIAEVQLGNWPGTERLTEAGAAVAELIEDRKTLADALAKLVCEPGKPEYRDQARAALARVQGGAG